MQIALFTNWKIEFAICTVDLISMTDIQSELIIFKMIFQNHQSLFASVLFYLSERFVIKDFVCQGIFSHHVFI